MVSTGVVGMVVVVVVVGAAVVSGAALVVGDAVVVDELGFDVVVLTVASSSTASSVAGWLAEPVSSTSAPSAVAGLGSEAQALNTSAAPRAQAAILDRCSTRENPSCTSPIVPTHPHPDPSAPPPSQPAPPNHSP